MSNYIKKAEAAEREGAHVAVILYLALEAEAYRGSDYHADAWNCAARDLLSYRDNLKKEKDKTAVEEFCALRHGHALSRDYDVDITVRLDPLPQK